MLTVLFFGCASNKSNKDINRGLASVENRIYESRKILDDGNFKPIVRFDFHNDEKIIILNKTTIDETDYFFYTFCRLGSEGSDVYSCQPAFEISERSSYIFPVERLNAFMGNVTDKLAYDEYTKAMYAPLVAGYSGMAATIVFNGNLDKAPMKRKRISFFSGALAGTVSLATYIGFKLKVEGDAMKSIDMKKVISEFEKSLGENVPRLSLGRHYKAFEHAIERISSSVEIRPDMNGNQIFVIIN